MRKNWKVKHSDSEAVKALMSEMNISRPLADILVSRGYDSSSIASDFISPENSVEYDPFLLKDMNEAVDRIRNAIKNRETIGIIGDYDVDGITATAIIYKYLHYAGVSVKYHIPSREGEGYGINIETLKKMKALGCSLIISVDCGITAIEEVEFAKTLGVDMIITDHHEVGENIPDAVAVINPKRPDDPYPFSKLSGVGVAYKLASALGIENHKEEFIAFAALGTLADMMPVTGENRKIIIDGMKFIQQGVNIGLSELMSKSGVSSNRFNSFSLSFIIAPRMNAAGRMENAETALKLLLEEDAYTAGLIAEKLCSLNKLRQETEAEIFKQAVQILENDDSYKNDKIIVLYDEKWHQGVIGIVAAKITEKYEKPAILFTSANGNGKGSGRSVTGFSIHKAVSECGELLTKFGGHEYAVGLGIEIGNIQAFREKINKIAECITIEKRSLIIDAELFDNEISFNTVEQLSLIEPFGEGNPQPIFLVKDLKLAYMRVVGEKHTRMSFKKAAYSYDAIYYNNTPDSLDVYLGDRVDVVFSLSVNEYNGSENLQIVIKDISPTYNFIEVYEEFQEVCVSGNISDRADIPDFPEFELVYKTIAKLSAAEHKPMELLEEINKRSSNEISTLKLLVILSVFAELSLIDFKLEHNRIYVSVVKNAEKTSLDKSELLRRLKENE